MQNQKIIHYGALDFAQESYVNELKSKTKKQNKTKQKYVYERNKRARAI